MKQENKYNTEYDVKSFQNHHFAHITSKKIVVDVGGHTVL